MKKNFFAALAALIMAGGLATSCIENVDLNGKWDVVEVQGAAVTIDENPTITFKNGKYHAFTGVNIVNGDFKVKGDVLTLGEGMMTRMAGAPDAMALEDKIVALMADELTVAAVDGEITLSKDGVVVLRLAR